MVSEWESDEFFEQGKVRTQQIRNRWIKIKIAGGVFLLCLGVPLFLETLPRLKTRHYLRLLSEEFQNLRFQALKDQKAYQLLFTSETRLGYEWWEVSDCKNPTRLHLVKQGAFVSNPEEWGLYCWLGPSRLPEKALKENFCYDPWQAEKESNGETPPVGFGIGYVNDLSQSRWDRASFLVLESPEGEFSFD